MQEIIKNIIEIDRQAEEIYNQAVEQKNEIMGKMQSEIESMKAMYRGKTSKRLDIIHNQEEGFYQEAVKKVNSEYESMMEELEQSYQQHREEWVDCIFDRVLCPSNAKA